MFASWQSILGVVYHGMVNWKNQPEMRRIEAECATWRTRVRRRDPKLEPTKDESGFAKTKITRSQICRKVNMLISNRSKKDAKSALVWPRLTLVLWCPRLTTALILQRLFATEITEINARELGGLPVLGGRTCHIQLHRNRQQRKECRRKRC